MWQRAWVIARVPVANPSATSWLGAKRAEKMAMMLPTLVWSTTTHRYCTKFHATLRGCVNAG